MFIPNFSDHDLVIEKNSPPNLKGFQAKTMRKLYFLNQHLCEFGSEGQPCTKGAKASCIGPALYKFCPNVGDGATYCTLYIVHCTMYTVHCKVYGVQCTLYSVHCKAYSTVPARILSADMIYRPDRTQLHGFLLQQREEGLDGAVGHLGRQLYSLQGRNCILYNVSIVFSSVSIVLSSVSIVFPPSPLPGRSIH